MCIGKRCFSEAHREPRGWGTGMLWSLISAVGCFGRESKHCGRGMWVVLLEEENRTSILALDSDFAGQ